ncbi:hypothetical protein F0562_014324 [Nyssa sinensis]|uniref:Uncharacterized protein n=1 Tax=Nyssa sinensis TaxID=561372 RepID=A0A5J4ZQT5_9ASTE|nr:hypothetical protein F0562_014324 [Nyssa sinensis]
MFAITLLLQDFRGPHYLHLAHIIIITGRQCTKTLPLFSSTANFSLLGIFDPLRQVASSYLIAFKWMVDTVATFWSSHQNTLLADSNLSKCSESHLENEEEEDEDVDFNPFLKETLSLEASSSLSSEIEGLDADVVDSGGNICAALVTNLSSKPPGLVEGYTVGDSEHGEEIVFQATVSSERACGKESEKTSSTRLEKRKSVLISEPENETFCERENGSGTDCC